MVTGTYIQLISWDGSSTLDSCFLYIHKFPTHFWLHWLIIFLFVEIPSCLISLFHKYILYFLACAGKNGAVHLYALWSVTTSSIEWEALSCSLPCLTVAALHVPL